MKVALTGATGHLGAAILPVLAKREHAVKVLLNNSSLQDSDQSIEIIRGNLFDKESVKQLMQDADLLIHCAAVISVNGDPQGMVHRTNVGGTRMVMETALEAGVKRAVHISSIHAHEQKPSNQLLDEDRAMVSDKAFAYDRSKKAGQEIALSFNEKGMEVLVLNPTSIIGPYDFKPSKMGKVLLDLCKGKLPFVFNGGFDFCDSRDVAEAVVNALTMGRPGEHYLLGGKWHSFEQLGQLLSKAMAKKIRPLSLPVWIGKMGLPVVSALALINRSEPLYTSEALEAIASGNRNISSEKASRELGYTPRPLEETIADTINWFKQKGYLV
ncbi:MAG: NAD-dependent epimerase/dehydratase family protein [Chitinophagaceae bacterium]|nr:NAD-dependent epimerase/dehydratase family protein [Chitinophagaceae bacterium]